MRAPIQLVATDLDGTLLNSQHELTPRTEAALKAAMARSVQIILATGKTRASAADLIQRLGLKTPGVYNQGLALYDGDGQLIYQQTLDPALAQQVIDLAEAEDYTIKAYNGVHTFVRAYNRHTAFLSEHHEPPGEAIGTLRHLPGTMPINKVVIVDDPPRIREARALLSARFDAQIKLVQAIPECLELLPPGASKGEGLRRLLEYLGIAPEHVMAVGDGENDMEMIKLVGIGVAVGNAYHKLKAAADYVVASNDEDGVGEAIERFVLAPQS
jgi:Cof subfamily protein (haloacid dehalogenase superfamily)